MGLLLGIVMVVAGQRPRTITLDFRNSRSASQLVGLPVKGIYAETNLNGGQAVVLLPGQRSISLAAQTVLAELGAQSDVRRVLIYSTTLADPAAATLAASLISTLQLGSTDPMATDPIGWCQRRYQSSSAGSTAVGTGGNAIPPRISVSRQSLGVGWSFLIELEWDK